MVLGRRIFDLYVLNIDNCVKGVQIWSFSGPYFPTVGLNTGKSYSVQMWKKSGPEKTPYLDTFRAVDAMKITSTDKFTLLSVSIDNKLTFKNHIDKLCRKASSKHHALLRIRPFFLKRKNQVTWKCFY